MLLNILEDKPYLWSRVHDSVRRILLMKMNKLLLDDFLKNYLSIHETCKQSCKNKIDFILKNHTNKKNDINTVTDRWYERWLKPRDLIIRIRTESMRLLSNKPRPIVLVKSSIVYTDLPSGSLAEKQLTENKFILRNLSDLF